MPDVINKDGTRPFVGVPIKILYKNHRDEIYWRRVIPLRLKFEDTPHHKQQWIFRAYDIDKQAERSFALLDILRIDPIN